VAQHSTLLLERTLWPHSCQISSQSDLKLDDRALGFFEEVTPNKKNKNRMAQWVAINQFLAEKDFVISLSVVSIHGGCDRW